MRQRSEDEWDPAVAGQDEKGVQGRYGSQYFKPRGWRRLAAGFLLAEVLVEF